MSLGRFRKTPDERKRYGIDYSDWLDSTEVVTAHSYEVVPPGELAVDGEYIAATNKAVVFYVRGGVAGEKYKVLVEVTTSTGQLREDVVVFTVYSP